jgi:hypothetical protein
MPRFPPAPHLGRAPARLPNAAVGHRPGIPRTPRSRRPVRLAITVVLKITLTPGKFFQINHMLNHSLKKIISKSFHSLSSILVHS